MKEPFVPMRLSAEPYAFPHVLAERNPRTIRCEGHSSAKSRNRPWNDQPGAYELHLDLNSSFRTTDGGLLNPTTDSVLKVNVSGRNAVRLRQLCERLVQSSIKAPTFQAQSDAARALSHIADPVAVPCIESLFRATDRFDPLITQALGRIGTEEARRALEEMFKSNDEDRFRLAADVLGRFQQRDP